LSAKAPLKKIKDIKIRKLIIFYRNFIQYFTGLTFEVMKNFHSIKLFSSEIVLFGKFFCCFVVSGSERVHSFFSDLKID